MLEPQVLTEEQIQFWDERGYFVTDVLFDERQLDDICRHMALVFAQKYETNVPPNKIDWWPGDPKTSLKKLDNGWWADETIRRLVLNPTLGAIAAQLAKADTIRLFQDQLLDKPGIGRNTPRSAAVGWHQDYAYWQCATPDHLLTARVAINEETRENGCMQVIRGSHRWPMQSTKHFFQADADVNDLPAFDVPAGETIERIYLTLKRGQVSFHHCRTIHGSTENRTEHPRRTMIVHMMPGDTRYQAGTGEHPWNVAVLANQKEDGLKDGDLWEGDRFPVLHSSAGGVKHGP